jgi:hypothetical protein
MPDTAGKPSGSAPMLPFAVDMIMLVSVMLVGVQLAFLRRLL